MKQSLDVFLWQGGWLGCRPLGRQQEGEKTPRDGRSAPAVPGSLPRLPQAAVATTTEPRATSCKFLCNAYCKSYFSESPLQSSSVLHSQHLLQNNVKNNWFTSSRQMAIKSFSMFLYPIKLRLVPSIYILCHIKILEVLKIQQLKSCCN